MTMPYYVAPEQIMKDRADYARKGIARGRAMVAVRYADGVARCAAYVDDPPTLVGLAFPDLIARLIELGVESAQEGRTPGNGAPPGER